VTERRARRRAKLDRDGQAEDDDGAERFRASRHDRPDVARITVHGDALESSVGLRLRAAAHLV
jgi:hypothetical protein